jgi:hypothetical protein
MKRQRGRQVDRQTNRYGGANSCISTTFPCIRANITRIFSSLQTPSDGHAYVKYRFVCLSALPSNGALLVVYWFIRTFVYPIQSLSNWTEAEKTTDPQEENWEAKRFHINLHTIMTRVLKPSLIQ